MFDNVLLRPNENLTESEYKNYKENYYSISIPLPNTLKDHIHDVNQIKREFISNIHAHIEEYSNNLDDLDLLKILAEKKETNTQMKVFCIEKELLESLSESGQEIIKNTCWDWDLDKEICV